MFQSSAITTHPVLGVLLKGPKISITSFGLPRSSLETWSSRPLRSNAPASPWRRSAAAVRSWMWKIRHLVDFCPSGRDCRGFRVERVGEIILDVEMLSSLEWWFQRFFIWTHLGKWSNLMKFGGWGKKGQEVDVFFFVWGGCYSFWRWKMGRNVVLLCGSQTSIKKTHLHFAGMWVNWNIHVRCGS